MRNVPISTHIAMKVLGRLYLRCYRIYKSYVISPIKLQISTLYGFRIHSNRSMANIRITFDESILNLRISGSNHRSIPIADPTHEDQMMALIRHHAPVIRRDFRNYGDRKHGDKR